MHCTRHETCWSGLWQLGKQMLWVYDLLICHRLYCEDLLMHSRIDFSSPKSLFPFRFVYYMTIYGNYHWFWSLSTILNNTRNTILLFIHVLGPREIYDLHSFFENVPIYGTMLLLKRRPQYNDFYSTWMAEIVF